MSMLGFDAIGRLAPGQFRGSTVYTLPALSGAYVITGNAANVIILEAVAAAAFAEAGSPATFRFVEPASGAAYVITGNAANVIILEAEAAASYLVTGYESHFTRDFINWFPLVGPTPSPWSKSAAPSSGWTPVTPPSAIWTPDNAQTIAVPVTN